MSKLKSTLRIAANVAVTLVAVSAAIIYAQRPGAVTTIEYDGAEIVLHSDSTWSFARPAALSATENDDVFITLRDKRILWLKPDFTYTFTKTQPKTNRPNQFPTINVASTFTNVSYDQAHKSAVDDVYNRAATQLRPFIPTNPNQKAAQQKTAQTTAQAYLLACLKDEFKENEIDQSFGQIKGGNWKVDMKMNVPDFRVRKVIECLDVQLRPDDGAAAGK